MNCLHCEKETNSDTKQWCNTRCNYYYYRDRYRAGDFPDEESEVRICANTKCNKEFRIWTKFYNSTELICCCRGCSIQRSALNRNRSTETVLKFDRSMVCKREDGFDVQICSQYDFMLWKDFPCYRANCFTV